MVWTGHAPVKVMPVPQREQKRLKRVEPIVSLVAPLVPVALAVLVALAALPVAVMVAPPVPVALDVPELVSRPVAAGMPRNYPVLRVDFADFVPVEMPGKPQGTASAKPGSPSAQKVGVAPFECVLRVPRGEFDAKEKPALQDSGVAASAVEAHSWTQS